LNLNKIGDAYEEEDLVGGVMEMQRQLKQAEHDEEEAQKNAKNNE
jgi:hypothetical protein